MKKSANKIPIKNRTKYHPFFIIGSGRSGNTLLRRILNNHDDLYIPPETYVLGKVINNYDDNHYSQWDELVDQTLSIFESDPEFETFNLKNLNELRQSLSLIDQKKRSLATIINSFYEYYKLTHNIEGTRWGDKTPLNVYCLNALNSVFPDAKFIHIIRDPIDSISSYLKSGIYSNINDATERWVNAVELCCAFGRRNPHKYIEVQYSQLVEQSQNTAKEICDFLELDFQKPMLDTNIGGLGDVPIYSHHANVANEINTGSLGKGLKELSKIEQELILKRLSTSNNSVVKIFLEKHMIIASKFLPIQEYIEKRNEEIDRIERKFSDINNSISYKIGRAATSPIRLTRELPETMKSTWHKIVLLTDGKKRAQEKNKKKLKEKGVFFIDKKEILRKTKKLNKICPELEKEKKLIVSLTSFPGRIPDLCFNIYSLLDQSLQPDILILWLAKQEFPRKEKDLPKSLLDLRKKGLTIKWCSDIKSYKKLINAIKEYPKDIIVTADDDIYYPKNWLELLHQSYLKEPNFIHCHRAHKIEFNTNGLIKAYSEWPKCIRTKETTPLNFFTTGGGVLFPPNSLFKDTLNEELFLSLCPTADDIWFWAMAVLNKTKIKVIQNNIRSLIYINPEIEYRIQEGVTLGSINEIDNDIQLGKIIDHYKELKNIIFHHRTQH